MSPHFVLSFFKNFHTKIGFFSFLLNILSFSPIFHFDAYGHGMSIEEGET